MKIMASLHIKMFLITGLIMLSFACSSSDSSSSSSPNITSQIQGGYQIQYNDVLWPQELVWTVNEYLAF